MLAALLLLIMQGLTALGLAIILGVLWGVFSSASVWAGRHVMHRLNKRGAATYLIMSGDPGAVRSLHEVSLRVMENIKANQAADEKVGVADDEEKNQAA